MECNIDTLQLCGTGHDDVSRTRTTTLAFILSEIYPLMVSDAILCPLRYLNTDWYIIMILQSYEEQVMTIKNDNSPMHIHVLSVA